MKIKKLIAPMLATAVVAGVSAQAKTLEFTIDSQDLYVSENGIRKEALDAPACIENGRTLVPIRVISEEFGAAVEWKAEEKKAVITLGETVIEITIGENKAVVNGEEKTLDTPAVIAGGRTMVPLRFISEELEKTVEYVAMTRQVIITDEPAVMKIGDTVYNMEDYRTLCTYFGVNESNIEAFLPQATEYLKQNASFTEAAKSMGIAPGEAEVSELGAEMLESGSDIYAATLMAPIAKIRTGELGAYKFIDSFELILSEEDIKKEYEENYIMAKHILIATSNLTTGEEYSPAEKGAARSKCDEVLMKLREGADFDALVKEYNEDPGMTQSPEGYVFTFGEMVEPFEKAAYALKPGQVSDVVESAYGYHIIKREALPEITEQYISPVEMNLREKAIYEKAEGVAVEEYMTPDEIIAALFPAATEEN